MDTTAPRVVSIDRAQPSVSLTKAGSVTYTVTFSEEVKGVGVSNFRLTSNGIKQAFIDSVSRGSGNAWKVVVSTGTGSGTLGLDMIHTTGVGDYAGNPVVGLPFEGEAYTVDKAAPRVLSITRKAPERMQTNASRVTVTYRVAFSEPVKGLTVPNFSVPTRAVVGASITSVAPAVGNDWAVTVDTGTGNGGISLNLVNTTGITDGAGNGVSTPMPVAGEIYLIDRLAPAWCSAPMPPTRRRSPPSRWW